MNKLTSWKSTLLFYRFNPHAIPGIKQLLCKMGRHDYMAEEIKENGVILTCFYCERQRLSMMDTNVRKNNL